MAVVKFTDEYKVNMGNYEHRVFGLDVMLNNADDYPDLTVKELIAQVKSLVAEGLKDDIVAAHEDTEQDKSFIHLHPFNQA